MTVSELIVLLQTFDGDLPVCYMTHSEYVMLDKEGWHAIKVMELQPPRADGWVHDKRPDKPSIKYLVFPGN